MCLTGSCVSEQMSVHVCARVWMDVDTNKCEHPVLCEHMYTSVDERVCPCVYACEWTRRKAFICVSLSSWVVPVPCSSFRAVEAGIQLEPNQPIPLQPILAGSAGPSSL